MDVETTQRSGLGRLLEEAPPPGALHARTINPQFVRMLRVLGFDRAWVRGENEYLYDAEGERYLDLLGGFGMYALGRNDPRIREALIEALGLETPGSLQLGLSPLPGLLARELLDRAPASLGRVLFTSSGTESVEAALTSRSGHLSLNLPRIGGHLV